MLTRIALRNFKRFERVAVDLGSPVVFLGPNNSGKSTVMQALALWQLGLRHWAEKRSRAKNAAQGPGVTLSRRDLFTMPVPKANLLWRNLRVRDVRQIDGRVVSSNVRIEIEVEGTTGGSEWACGLEFDYANEESIYCRPLRTEDRPDPPRMPVPAEAMAVRAAYLPPIAGLAAVETLLAPGAVDVRVGEGRTAEVLRNLCYAVSDSAPDRWESLAERMRALFGVDLREARLLAERGEVTLSFWQSGCDLDISAAGQGLHQTLLVLAFMHARPGSVLLLDEPDAHLEPLRQRQAFRAMREVAVECGCQLVLSTRSEVLLNEAADQDLALVFVGTPHRIGRESRKRVARAIREIGFEHYLQAEQTGWVLYLRDPDDLAALEAFARRLGRDDAIAALQRPFVRYVSESWNAATRHFESLAGVLPELLGLALVGGGQPCEDDGAPVPGLTRQGWQRGRMPAYVCTRSSLESYAVREASREAAGPLFAAHQAQRRVEAMRAAIEETASAARGERGASDDTLDDIFRAYRARLREDAIGERPRAGDLVEDLPDSEIDAEIREKLDAVVDFAERARRNGPA